MLIGLLTSAVQGLAGGRPGGRSRRGQVLVAARRSRLTNSDSSPATSPTLYRQRGVRAALGALGLRPRPRLLDHPAPLLYWLMVLFVAAFVPPVLAPSFSLYGFGSALRSRPRLPRRRGAPSPTASPGLGLLHAAGWVNSRRSRFWAWPRSRLSSAGGAMVISPDEPVCVVTRITFGRWGLRRDRPLDGCTASGGGGSRAWSRASAFDGRALMIFSSGGTTRPDPVHDAGATWARSTGRSGTTAGCGRGSSGSGTSSEQAVDRTIDTGSRSRCGRRGAREARNVSVGERFGYCEHGKPGAW